MTKLIILGSSNAIPDPTHENTHMVLVGDERMLLVDCVNNPLLRLTQAGLDYARLTDLLLTHFHPDHVSGVPTLLMNSWLLGRKNALDMYGLAYTLDRIERLMIDYDWETWPRFYPVHFHRQPEEEMALMLSCPEFRVFSSPVHHLVPTIGLRIEFPKTGKVLAYSCDTEPCAEVIRLAEGADVLIHESTGSSLGHSSAEQAGQIAAQAGVKELLLIHYRTGGYDARQLVMQAQQCFPGPVDLAVDFMEIEF